MTDLSDIFAHPTRRRGCSARLLNARRESVSRVKARCRQLKWLTDRELGNMADGLRSEAPSEKELLAPETLVSVFALVRESIRRNLNVELYDVQLLAGIALAHGEIAEMQTGEGKTLAAVAPAALRALAGQGVHVITVNRYLAQRDFLQLKPVFETLRLSAGLVKEGATPAAKRAAYCCDVTYGPGYEFGFDYLRDQSASFDTPRNRLGQEYRDALNGEKSRRPEPLQRGHRFAIIDEIDSVLIDEAYCPLVLSQAPAASQGARNETPYHEACRLAGTMRAGRDYTVDPATKQVHLSERGYQRVERHWDGRKGLEVQRPWPVYVQQALQAELVLEKDVDYVVRDGSVHIVDDATGRIFADRIWRDGLHQAVEIKERLGVTGERGSLARISRQRYFALYDTICGMTGTAQGSEREFRALYRLPVTVVPPRRRCQRRQYPTRFFPDRGSKWRALVGEVARLHRSGQPILIGTRSIGHSEQLSERLRKRGIPHRVLNGKQDESEATVVARAGEVGAVTIATNMAGRGTDIKLCRAAIERGGLHVMGEECHDVQRIDRQLIGRAARQGDPGSCQLFVSADDNVICLHGGKMDDTLRRRTSRGGTLCNNLSRQVERIQRKVERENYGQRRKLLRHDRWLEETLDKVAKEDVL